MSDTATPLLSRRLFLKGSALIGCSAAAYPLMTTVTMAAAPGEERLVVIILRGAMDGLDVVRPVGDPTFASLRSADLAGDAAPLPLDNFFALHPAMAKLMPLWNAGELGFAHAVATPYRNKRSHFDGQDILEAGTGLDVPELRVRDGWLNRMLQSMPGLGSQTAYAVGHDEMKVIEGKAPVMNWAPGIRLNLSQQSRSLLEMIYNDDPLFHQASAEAMAIIDKLNAEAANNTADGSMAGGMGGGMMAPPIRGVAALGAFAAGRMREDTRIATFSITGWDTHHNQRPVLSRQLSKLSETILALKSGLGPAWKKTTVLAMTEFGRTARENGTTGTDHGTGGAMLMAGGAIRGGRVYGRWPGLTEADLFGRRDLMPTADVRAYAAWAMRGLYGLDKGLLERTVFPGLDMGTDPGFIA